MYKIIPSNVESVRGEVIHSRIRFEPVKCLLMPDRTAVVRVEYYHPFRSTSATCRLRQPLASILFCQMTKGFSDERNLPEVNCMYKALDALTLGSIVVSTVPICESPT